MQLETDSWACIPKVQCTAKMRPSRLATQSGVGKPGLRDQSLRKGKQSERDRQTLDTKLESQNMGPHSVSIVVWAGGKQSTFFILFLWSGAASRAKKDQEN